MARSEICVPRKRERRSISVGGSSSVIAMATGKICCATDSLWLQATGTAPDQCLSKTALSYGGLIPASGQAEYVCGYSRTYGTELRTYRTCVTHGPVERLDVLMLSLASHRVRIGKLVAKATKLNRSDPFQTFVLISLNRPKFDLLLVVWVGI
jgi:hypothetical protein